MKLNNEFRVLEFYKNMSDSYNQGVSLNNIEEMIMNDYDANENTKQSFINNEYDFRLAKLALDFLRAKVYNFEEYDELKETFFDKCIDKKEEFQNVIDDGVSIDNLETMIDYDISLYRKNNENTAIKSEKDKRINKLALSLLKKENN